MDYKDYIKLIGSADIKPVCVLSGDEEYVKNTVIERLKKAYVEPSMLDFDLSVFDDATVTYDSILPCLSAPAFMSERKLVLLNVKPDNAIFKDEGFVKLCEEADETVLIIIAVSGKTDKRLGCVKKIEAVADLVSFDKPEKADLIKWVVREFKNNGKRITPSDAEYLISMAGEDLFSLQNEVGKVASSTEEDAVTRNDIDEMIAHTPEHGVFALVDAVAAKKTAEAYRQTALLLNDGSEAFQLLALVERQLQLILRYLGCNQSGMSQKETMEKLALKPFVYDKVKRQAANFTVGSCKDALSMCLEVDRQVKTGRAEARSAFEMLIVKLCEAKK